MSWEFPNYLQIKVIESNFLSFISFLWLSFIITQDLLVPWHWNKRHSISSSPIIPAVEGKCPGYPECAHPMGISLCPRFFPRLSRTIFLNERGDVKRGVFRVYVITRQVRMMLAVERNAKLLMRVSFTYVLRIRARCTHIRVKIRPAEIPDTFWFHYPSYPAEWDFARSSRKPKRK